MVDFDSPAWKTVCAASGDVAELLKKLLQKEGGFRETLDILAEDLSHQLSFYNATALALPHLARLCQTLSIEDKLYLIAKIGPAVATEAIEPLPRDSVLWQEFQEGLAPLAQETKDLLEHHANQIKALPNDLPLVFAIAALALLGDRNHAYCLYLGMPLDELPAMCSNEDCGWFEECIEFSLEEEPAYVTPGDLGEEGGWFGKLLAELDDEYILPRLPYLYGTCTCPECGESGPYWEWLHRAYEEG